MRRRRQKELTAAITAAGAGARVSGRSVLAWPPGREGSGGPLVVVRPQWWPGDRVLAAGKLHWRRWPPRRVWVYDIWRMPRGWQPRADIRRTSAGVVALLAHLADAAPAARDEGGNYG